MAPVTREQLDRINYVNIGLMFLSAGFAYFFPFHCFLVAFAVLGPLHYLTEISWLQGRSFFSKNRWDFLVLVGLAVLDTYAKQMGIEDWLISRHTIRIAFLSAGAMAFIQDPQLRWTGILAAFASVYLPLSYSQNLFFSVFLSTLVHVYVFTWMFVLHGALKSRSRSGYLSLVVHTGLGVALLCLPPPWLATLSDSVKDSMKATGDLNYRLAFTLGWDVVGPQATVAMQFVAFAYTYHYLNWFSKTRVIAWHQVSKPRLFTIGALWIGFVGLYAYEFRTGLAALLALSLGHALLEFPLNLKTSVGIFQEIRARFAHPPRQKKRGRRKLRRAA